MTHWRLAVEMWSARWADGKAMVTMDASRTIINCATTTTARIAHLLGPGSGPVPVSRPEEDAVTISLHSTVPSPLRSPGSRRAVSGLFGNYRGHNDPVRCTVQ